MSDALDNYRKPSVGWIHVSPWIPPRLLQNAVRAYARITRQEKPLALLDTSAVGNGEEGVLLTDCFMHAWCDGRRQAPIAVQNVRSIVYVPEYNGKAHLFFDGRRFVHFPMTFVDQLECKRFLAVLESYAREKGAESAYLRVIPIVGAPEATELDDEWGRQAMQILRNQ